MSKSASQTEKQQALENLHKYLKPGDTVHTILRHCSRSGMSRSISLVITANGETTDVTYWAARAMGDNIDQKHGGIKIGGCGMDMGFSLVYNLGYAMWPKGTPEPHGTRKGEPDSDGGYALKQCWL